MKWTFEKLQEEALKYKDKKEFIKNNRNAYQAAQKKGFLGKICQHMTKRSFPLKENSSNFKWPEERLREEALKHKNKKDFFEKSFNAYQAAIYWGILDKICSHMPKRIIIPKEKHSQFKWTVDKIKEEALKYKFRQDFKNNSAGAWSAAQERGILDEVCFHMPYGCNSSMPELFILDTIKAIYPKAQKLVDRKVKIVGKPHIKGFDLDIYVPELRKGIEFDGTYHHSEDFLIKSKTSIGWTEEEAKNYHLLKDNWFNSKGISVLHIKEEDWHKDKEYCIQKCLEFLETDI